MQGNGNAEVDLDATMTTLGPEDDTSQGLILTNKQRVMYRPPAGKSVLGIYTYYVHVRCVCGAFTECFRCSMDPCCLVLCFTLINTFAGL